MTPFQPPSEADYLSEALRFIDVCKTDCSCADHWHYLWAGLKAAGLRRGVYQQHGAFQQALEGRRREGMKILIAGAADAGSLHVLNAALGSIRAEFTVVDHCPAPLTMVREYAELAGLDVRTQCSDISQLPPSGPWDLILIHNTLVLIGRAARLAALNAASQALSPGGLILCNSRYNAPASRSDQNVLADEIHMIKERVHDAFRAQPEVVGVIAPLVSHYVASQDMSMVNRPTRSELMEEITGAGLEVFDSIPDEKVLPSIVSARNADLQIRAELLLVRRASHP